MVESRGKFQDEDQFPVSDDGQPSGLRVGALGSSYRYVPAREIPSGIYGVTGMMLGILGLITAPVLVGLVIGLIAFALSVVGIRRTRKSDLMLWPSVAGVIVSSMAVLVGVLFVVAFYDTAYI